MPNARFFNPNQRRDATQTHLVELILATRNGTTGLFKPYRNKEEQLGSLADPIYYSVTSLANVAELVVDLVALVEAMINRDSDASLTMLEGFAYTAASIVLCAVNAVVSLCSLLTRNLATLGNGGYQSYTSSLYADARDFFSGVSSSLGL